MPDYNQNLKKELLSKVEDWINSAIENSDTFYESLEIELSGNLVSLELSSQIKYTKNTKLDWYNNPELGSKFLNHESRSEVKKGESIQ